jgi:hypothetical protein
VFHCVAESEAGEGGIVACFDGSKPEDVTGYPAEAWWRWTSVLMLGRLQALLA